MTYSANSPTPLVPKKSQSPYLGLLWLGLWAMALQRVLRGFQILGFSGVQSALATHLLLIMALFWAGHRWTLSLAPRLWLRTLAPGGLLLVGCLFLCFFGETSGHSLAELRIYELAIAVTVVPFAEELFYRGLLSPTLSAHFGRFFGRYLSVLTFSALHTDLSVEGLLAGAGGLALGPLLLGGAAELSYAWTGNLWAPIGLHAMANLSGALFLLYSPQWLERFAWLYS